jgi:hypothetical protein
MAEALLALYYLAGGPGITLPLAPFLAATSLAGFRARLLPGWLSRVGIASSVLCLASVAGGSSSSGQGRLLRAQPVAYARSGNGV